MAEEVQKKLIIKKKIYNRLQKESKFYENEIEQLNDTIEQMEKEDPENYEINKKKEMVEESEQVLKEVKKKTEQAQEDLYNFIEDHLDDDTLNNEIISDL